MPSSRNKEERLALPKVVHPPDTVCFQVRVPNERGYLAAFFGVIGQLAQWRTWALDDAHTAKEVAAVWREIYFSLDGNRCPDAAQTAGAGGGDEFMLRQSPTNPCLLETSVDGVTWCAWADLSKCIVPPAQPGAGTEQPPAGGGQACYHAVLNANSRWLIPAPLNTGDVITINNGSGAVSNSHDARWNCIDGGQFFAGACVGFQTTNGANPVPAAPTSSLVVEINGTFYSLSSGSFTVPSSVSNAQAVIQVNDSSISGLAGQFTFDACVTNNQAASWSLSQNLQLINGGWTPSLDGFAGTESAWSSGTGWQQVACTANNANTARYDIVYLELVFLHTTTLKHVDLTYDSTIGDLSDGGGDAVQAYYSGAWHTLVGQASANGTNRTLVWDGTQGSVEKMRVLLYGADLTGTSCPTPGTATFKQFAMNGVGANPF